MSAPDTSLPAAVARANARHAAAVVQGAYGHLDVDFGTEHYGQFCFAVNYIDQILVFSSCFPTFGEGPCYYYTRKKYVEDLVKERLLWKQRGVYRFIGRYKMHKSGDSEFIGSITYLGGLLLPAKDSGEVI